MEEECEGGQTWSNLEWRAVRLRDSRLGRTRYSREDLRSRIMSLRYLRPQTPPLPIWGVWCCQQLCSWGSPPPPQRKETLRHLVVLKTENQGLFLINFIFLVFLLLGKLWALLETAVQLLTSNWKQKLVLFILIYGMQVRFLFMFHLDGLFSKFWNLNIILCFSPYKKLYFIKLGLSDNIIWEFILTNNPRSRKLCSQRHLLCIS